MRAAISAFRCALLCCLAILCAIGCTEETVEVTMRFSYEASRGVDWKPTDERIAALEEAIGLRLGERGTVTRVRAGKGDTLEIDARVKDQKKLNSIIRRLIIAGVLEFAVVAKPGKHDEIIKAAKALDDENDDLMQKGKIVAGWRTIAHDESGKQKSIELLESAHRKVTRKVHRNRKQETAEVVQMLVAFEPPEMRVSGEYLKRAFPGRDADQNTVDFLFNQQGGYLFGVLTDKYKPSPDGLSKYRLAIVLDDEIHSAPSINAVITTRGQITGRFTKEEVNELVDVLNAGALPIRLKHLSTK